MLRTLQTLSGDREALKYRLLVESPFINWLNRAIRPRNWWVRLKTKETLQRALSSGKPIKLNIGCGRTRLDDTWLHADIHRGDVYLDIFKPFPLPENSVNYIFSEHFIEHLPEAKMRQFWKECHRVLKPGGWMRHSTPDMEFLVKLYLGQVEGVDMDKFYDRIRHIRKETPHRCVYMNEVIHLWGHLFVYDESYLTKVWQGAGFSEIRRTRFGESIESALSGLEQHSRVEWIQNGFTLILEAKKEK